MNKFPRYTREQNLACKLSNDDIKEIKRLRKLGFLLKDIGKIFQVSSMAVFYWLLTKQQRKEKQKGAYVLYGKFRDKEDKRQRDRKSLKRKRKLMPISFSKYRKQF